MFLNCGVGEDSWESLGLQGDPISPSKGNQSWIIIGRTDVEAEIPIFWPPDVKSWLIGKDPDAGKDWRWEEKGTTEDEMVGWHDRLNRHRFGWTLAVGDGQGGLAWCSPRGCRVRHDWVTELNWDLLMPSVKFISFQEVPAAILQVKQASSSQSQPSQALIGIYHLTPPTPSTDGSHSQLAVESI